jgi:hypothetical protein
MLYEIRDTVYMEIHESVWSVSKPCYLMTSDMAPVVHVCDENVLYNEVNGTLRSKPIYAVRIYTKTLLSKPKLLYPYAHRSVRAPQTSPVSLPTRLPERDSLSPY